LKPAAHAKRKEKFVDLRWENKEGRTGLKRHEQIGDENKKKEKKKNKAANLKRRGRVGYIKEERRKKSHSFPLHFILTIDKKKHM